MGKEVAVAPPKFQNLLLKNQHENHIYCPNIKFITPSLLKIYILHTYICDITSHKSKFSTIRSVFPLFFCKWDILTYGLHTSGRFHDRTKRSYSSDGPNTRDTWSVDENNYYTCEITTANVN